MTRKQVADILRQMERVRELAHEVESKKRARQFLTEYRRMWKAISPYVTGKKPYSEPKAKAA
jgi:hypothetical protein